MAQLAIKGHVTRGNEVIEILEMLGGINVYSCNGYSTSRYYIIVNNEIGWCHECDPESNFISFTLEEFLKMFPYKVGDKVAVTNNKEYYEGEIKTMRWHCMDECVLYQVDFVHNLRVENLLPRYNDSTTEIIEERRYKEFRMPLGDDDKLATEAIIDGKKILPPNGYLIGKITQVDNGMLVEYVKQQPQYPKTYEGCCKVLGYSGNYNMMLTTDVDNKLFDALYRLKVCRDAYWKLYGEEMGLGKRWEPDWSIYEHKFCLGTDKDKVIEECVTTGNRIFAFPTKEMRDAFYENFKELIERCKELL